MAFERHIELEEIAGFSRDFLLRLDRAGVLADPGLQDLQLHARMLAMLIDATAVA